MQRKGISVFLAFISVVILFASCKKDQTPDSFFPERTFSVHMTAKKGEKSFGADIICRSHDDIEIAFTSPVELSGFSVRDDGKKYSVNIFGVSDELRMSEMKDSALLNILFSTIKTAVFSNHGLFVPEEGDGYKATFNTDGTIVSVTFSSDGYIRSLTADSLGFSAQFS